MSKPTDDLTWGTDASAAVVEPSLGSKIVGWLRGNRGPASWLNWWMRGVYRWNAWWDTVLSTDDAQTVTIAALSSATKEALTVTSAATNKGAIKATGNGTGPGVVGTNSGAGGHGVEGFHAGGSGGAGVYGEDSSGAAIGVEGVSLGAGLGGYFSSISGAPVRINPGAQPSTSGGAVVGDMYVTVAGVLKICTVAGSPGTWVSVGSQT